MIRRMEILGKNSLSGRLYQFEKCDGRVYLLSSLSLSLGVLSENFFSLNSIVISCVIYHIDYYYRTDFPDRILGIPVITKRNLFQTHVN
jgi:hypothetical protein